MKRIVTLLLFLAPVVLFAQDKDKKKKKKEKPSPEQLAAQYLQTFQQNMGFDSLKVAKHWMAGEEGYPKLTYQFTVNVTTNAKTYNNFEAYNETIIDTLNRMRRIYMGILLDTSGRKYQRMQAERKFIETKTYVEIEYGKMGEQRQGRSLTGDTYAPGREW